MHSAFYFVFSAFELYYSVFSFLSSIFCLPFLLMINYFLSYIICLLTLCILSTVLNILSSAFYPSSPFIPSFFFYILSSNIRILFSIYRLQLFFFCIYSLLTACFRLSMVFHVKSYFFCMISSVSSFKFPHRTTTTK